MVRITSPIVTSPKELLLGTRLILMKDQRTYPYPLQYTKSITIRRTTKSHVWYWAHTGKVKSEADDHITWICTHYIVVEEELL